MAEDQLTRAERIRLESLAQANQRWAMKPAANDQEIMTTALRFESFLLDAPSVKIDS